MLQLLLSFFFFNDTATTDIFTLSLHDALPICALPELRRVIVAHGNQIAMEATLESSLSRIFGGRIAPAAAEDADRKSTRLNSSHLVISYAVFCLKKKNSSTNICHQSDNDLYLS